MVQSGSRAASRLRSGTAHFPANHPSNQPFWGAILHPNWLPILLNYSQQHLKTIQQHLKTIVFHYIPLISYHDTITNTHPMMSSLHPLQWLSAQVQVEDSWFLLGATWKVQGELKHQHPWNSMATWGTRFSTSNIHQYPAFLMRHNRMCIYNIISYIHNYMSILCINAYYTCLCYNQKYEIGPSTVKLKMICLVVSRWPFLG